MNNIKDILEICSVFLSSQIGLLGIFMLFRINRITETLIGQAKALLIEFTGSENPDSKDCPESLKESLTEDFCNKHSEKPNQIIPRIKKAIARKDIFELELRFRHIKMAIEEKKNNNSHSTETMKRDYERYKSLLNFRKLLLKLTVIDLILSTIVIISSMILIYGKTTNFKIFQQTSIVIFIASILLTVSMFLIFFTTCIIIFALINEKSYTGDTEKKCKGCQK